VRDYRERVLVNIFPFLVFVHSSDAPFSSCFPESLVSRYVDVATYFKFVFSKVKLKFS
jgi:hypothetical protein